MASHFEDLPTDILLPILSDLNIRQIATLQQCSKFLNRSLEPYTFSMPNTVDRLMRWGCIHGEKWAITKALTYGADVSVVEILMMSRRGQTQEPKPIRASTLGLAAGREQYGIIKFLLESGARLDHPNIHPTQSRALRQALFKPQKPRLLQLCLALGAKDQIPQFQSGIDEALISSVKQNHGLDNCRTWLDLGANPTSIGGKKQWDPETALSMAIMSGSVQITRLLLSRKPSLSIPKRCLSYTDNHTRYYSSCQPWHAIPILAAARYMATHGKTDMLEMIIEAGGDINASVEGYMEGYDGPLVRLRGVPTISPLYTYLYSVNPCDETISTTLKPSRGIEILYDKGVKHIEVDWNLTNLTFNHPCPLIMLCWARWGGFKCLLSGEAYDMLKVLVQKGAAKHAVGQLLVPPTGWPRKQPRTDGKGSPYTPAEYDLIMCRWSSLLKLMLVDDNFSDGRDGISYVLYEFLDGICWRFLEATIELPEPCPPEMLYQYIDESHPVTIRELLQAGADINWVASEPRKMTILETIAYRSSKHHYTTPEGERCYTYPLQIKRQRSFASMLVKLGARPPQACFDQSEKDREDPEYQKWLHSLRGDIPDEDTVLWNPKAGILLGM